MNRSDLQFLFDYNYWANARVMNAAVQLTPDQFSAPHGLSHGSVRGALVHVLGAEMVWRLRCQLGTSPAALPTEHDFPTLEALRARWSDEQAAMRAFIASLTDEQLSQTLEYKTTKGVPQSNILWQVLAHVVNHGTQFRAEAAVALTAAGHSPGDLDLLLFMREQASDHSRQG